jgi:large subunit ribosomal protein L29
MRAEEIRELKDVEIQARVGELQEERFRLRFRGATETLEEPLRIRAIRREVARLKTILRERELGTKKTPATAAATKAPAAKAKKSPVARAKKAGKATGGKTKVAAAAGGNSERKAGARGGSKS